MSDETFRIALDGGQSVTAVRVVPSSAALVNEASTAASAPSAAGWTFIYAPGAGSNIDDSFGRALSESFASSGIEVVRFQFPYVEAKRRFPDRPPILEATWAAVISQIRSEWQRSGGGEGSKDHRLAIGGRSMGGRIASQVVAGRAAASGAGAEVDAADALVLFAYPLHPPGQPENLRTKHLPDIRVPTLFCSGTGDEFGTVDELRAAVGLVPGARLHLLEGADHGFGPVKGGGGSRREIFEEAIRVAAGFIQGIGQDSRA